jgi:hypothetical protein
MPVVRRVAKPFLSSLLERYWPEIEHLSNGLGSAAAFKIPAFRYVPDLKALFALARGWVITKFRHNSANRALTDGRMQRDRVLASSLTPS